MKKTIITILLLCMVFFSACIVTKYIVITSNKEEIIQRNDEYLLKFYVKNPNQNTFTGTIEYQYDGTCLFSYTNNKTVTITPQRGREAFTTGFYYVCKDSHKCRVDDKCLQTPLRITVLVRDKGGEIKDSEDVLLTIIER